MIKVIIFDLDEVLVDTKMIHFEALNLALKKFKNFKFINAERIAKEGLSIPIDPNLSNKNLNIIVNTLNKI